MIIEKIIKINIYSIPLKKKEKKKLNIQETEK